MLISPAVAADTFVPGSRDGAQAGTPDRPVRLLSVGRLTWKKGHEFMLAAVRRLVDAGVAVEYHVIGDGSYRDAVASCVDQLGLRDAVGLMGSQPPEVVIAQLQWADVLVHGSIAEGFPNALLEAQAMELPVVCSDADGCREAVEDGVTAFVVPRRDVAALAARIVELAGAPELRARLGNAGRARVLSRFTPQRQVEAFAELYHTVSRS